VKSPAYEPEEGLIERRNPAKTLLVCITKMETTRKKTLIKFKERNFFCLTEFTADPTLFTLAVFIFFDFSNYPKSPKSNNFLTSDKLFKPTLQPYFFAKKLIT